MPLQMGTVHIDDEGREYGVRLATRQRMIDELTKIAVTAADNEIRIKAAELVLAHLTWEYGPAPGEQAPAPDEAASPDWLVEFGDYTRDFYPPKPAPKVEVTVVHPCGGSKSGMAEDGTRFTVYLDDTFIGSFCDCSRILNPHLRPMDEYIRQTIDAAIRSATA